MARVKRAARKPQPRNDRPRWFLRRGVWVTMLWLACAGGTAYGLHELDQRARSTTLQTAPARLVWENTPAWLDQPSWSHVLPGIAAHIGLDPDVDLYAPEVCPFVAERLRFSPWVEQVRRITKRIDGAVTINAAFRTPFVYIQQGNTAYLCDPAGVRLPEMAVPTDVNRLDWWVIEGVRSPPPRPGAAWEDDGLQAGLRLAKYLYDHHETLGERVRRQLIAIDVGNFNLERDPRAGRLQLVTASGTGRVYWGFPPGEEYGVESPPQRKLQLLKQVAERLGSLPADRFIDLRDEDAAWQGPLGPAPAAG